MKHRVTISILTYIALRQAKACIASVLKQTEPFKLILTANGNPQVAEYFTALAKEFANITVGVNENNQGFIEPHSRALTLCDTELFLLLNDDAILPEDALKKLIEPFDQFPNAALSGPKDDFQTLLPDFNGTKGKDFEYLNGACLMCKTEIVKKHGLFDPHLKFAYAEDSDLSLRMREQGYTLHKVDFRLIHERCATSKHVKEVKASQEANHAFCRKRWAHYLKVRKMDFPIVLKRTAAFGDVLLTTPVIRALKAKHPLSLIYVETSCPQIFDRNPHVKQASRQIPKMADAMVFNLDMTYEAKTNIHIVNAYAQKCSLGDDLSDNRTEFFPSGRDVIKAQELMPDDGKWAAIHAGPSTWRSKEWPQERWANVIEGLRGTGLKILLVGSHGKPLPNELDMRGRTNIHEMAALIKRAALFIGLDSLPMHISQAVGTPTVGLFGVTDPQWIMTNGSRHIGVCGNTESFGIRHRKPGTTVVDDGGAAMNSITVSMVLESATRMVNTEMAFA